MALSEADIDALIEEILNGSQELYVAAMSSLMVSHFMEGVSKLKDEAALLHLANQFPQQAKTILMQYQDVISDEIKRAVEDALKDSVAADLDQLKKIYGDDASKMAEHYWKQGATKHFVEVAKKTADQVAEIVRRQNILMEENAEKTWYAVTKDAVNEAVLGTKIRDKIVADAVTRLMDEGIKTIDYGHDGRPTVSNEVDVAVKRHIVSQVSQVGGQLSMDAMESYNHKFAITSAHYGARPSHARWQGLPGCLTGEVVVDGTKYPDFYVLTGYEGKRGPNVALGNRLKGVNCRHSVYPFFPGITKLPDREFKEAQKKWGKSSDDYYADLQRQRELERRIRKTKREIAGMEQAGLDLDNPDYVQKRLKLGKQQKSLKEWCDKNKLTRQPKREKAYGVLKQPRALKSTRASQFVAESRGRVNIEIDRFVPCLLDTKTGELVDTEVFRFSTKSALKGYNTKTGWDINWQKLPSDVEVYGLTLKGSSEIQGLIGIRQDNDAQATYLHYLKSAPRNDKRISGKQDYEGVGGHLLAIAAEQSIKSGFGGFMYGFAENARLEKHYAETYGAVHFGALHPYHFVISEQAALQILERYNYKWKQ